MTTTLDISTDGDKLKFDSNQLVVIAGDEVVLRFDNVSTVNQHNWVLVKAGTKDEVAAAGVAAGPDNDWIPLEDERVIAHTRLIEPGQTGEVRFTAPGFGTYQFVCTFPGHNAAGMFGEFVVN
ncbi:MAG: plastocyanin/azurin family copper-binding protein [Dehalococcoidia bacterium]